MLWNFKTILYVNCCINIGGYQILCTSLSMICKIVNRGSSNDDQCYVSPKWNFKERHSWILIKIWCFMKIDEPCTYIILLSPFFFSFKESKSTTFYGNCKTFCVIWAFLTHLKSISLIFKMSSSTIHTLNHE